MKIARILVGLALMCAYPAQTMAADSWLPSWKLSIDVLSKYVGGPNNILAYGKPVNQNNLWVGWDNGVYVNFWNSQVFSGYPVGNFGNEVDYTIGWAGGIGGGFGVDVSLSHYDLSAPKLFETRGDIIQLGVELNREFRYGGHTFTPYARVEPSWVTQGVAPFGAYYHAGIRHSWKLGESLALKDSARVVYDGGVYGANKGFNLRLDIGPVWKVTKYLDVRIPQVRYYVPLSHYGDGRKNQLIIGAGVDIHSW